MLPDQQAGIKKMRADGIAILTTDEKQRHDRMKHRLAADRFILGRILLRRVLARYLGEDPTDLKFRYGANGKPDLVNSFGMKLSFNLSNSASEIVVAVTSAPAIGIDLETMDRAGAAHRISQQIF